MQIHIGDCLDVLRTMPDNSMDAIVTDPPYGLKFMGKRWDCDVPSVDIWAECLRVLKPGGHLLAFAGTRTQHRMACRIEDAGFEIRDMIAWVYGSGFPKSLDVSKALDRSDASALRRDRQLQFTEWMRGQGMTAAVIDELTGTCMGSHYTTDKQQPCVATREHLEMLRPHFPEGVPEWVEQLVSERTVESENFKSRQVIGQREGVDTAVARPGIPLQDGAARRVFDVTAAHTAEAERWAGWGTALKPSLEPITMARKPLAGTVAANVARFGTGALNIDGCRVIGSEDCARAPALVNDTAAPFGKGLAMGGNGSDLGRWPANLIHDGSDEVVALFPAETGASPTGRIARGERAADNIYGGQPNAAGTFGFGFGDSGSAARFFYCPKADRADRNDGCGGMESRRFGMSGGAAAAAARGEDYDNGDSGINRTTMRQNHHPTVKPTDLMRYLCRLITPPGGTVLAPFMGSGSTGRGAISEGFRFIGIELDPAYARIAEARIRAVQPGMSFVGAA